MPPGAHGSRPLFAGLSREVFQLQKINICAGLEKYYLKLFELCVDGQQLKNACRDFYVTMVAQSDIFYLLKCDLKRKVNGVGIPVARLKRNSHYNINAHHSHR